MKKTYDVYSIFGKTSIRAFAALFVFSICFLGVTSEASAQTFNTNPITGAQNGLSSAQQADMSFIKDFVFDEANRETNVQLLRSEHESLMGNSNLASGPEEAAYGARVFYLSQLIETLSMTATPIQDAAGTSYTALVSYVDNKLSVAVDTEDIASYYLSLIDL